MMFVTRVNVDYGIPDMALIVFTDVVNDIISQCLVMLPMMIVFAKITPRRIEATAFAFLTGTYNLSSSLHGVVGSIVNSTFVGVSQDDLSKYWVLVSISIVMSVIPVMFLRLLPTRQQLDDL